MRPNRLSLPIASLAAAFALTGCGGHDDRVPTPTVPNGPPPTPAPAAPSAPPPVPLPETVMTAIVGKPAPLFRLKDQTGAERTLAEFQGKRVVLWFYPKANTGG